MDTYFVESVLGHGSFGKIVKALDSRTNQHVAIKIVALDSHDVDFDAQFEEICFHRLSRFSRVAQYITSFLSGSNLWIVMELCYFGSLNQIIAKSGYLPENLALYVIKNIALGLVHVHALGFIHGDIKPQNILISADGYVKISDFGSACMVSSFNQFFPVDSVGDKVSGTFHYASPEIIVTLASKDRINKIRHQSSDTWSLGIVFIELVTGNPPLSHLDPRQVTSLVTQGLLSPPLLFKTVDFSTITNADVVFIISSCLEYDVSKRIELNVIINMIVLHDNDPCDMVNFCNSCHSDVYRDLMEPGLSLFKSSMVAYKDDANVLLLMARLTDTLVELDHQTKGDLTLKLLSSLSSSFLACVEQNDDDGELK